LEDELGEDDLEAYGNAPWVKDQTKFSKLSEFTSVGLLAHLTVGLDFKAMNQSRKGIHAQIAEDCSYEEI